MNICRKKVIDFLFDLLKTNYNIHNISESTIFQNLGLDSLDRLNIVLQLEKEYRIDDFSSYNFHEKTSVNDLVNEIMKRKKEE